MSTIEELKELEATPTPLFLLECTLANGDVERWGTHAVTFDGHAYGARLLRHNLFELRSSPEDGLDGAAKISLSLANADSHFSQVERATGFKGAQITIRFAFFDLVEGEAVSEARVVFRGVASTPDEITEDTLRVTFANRFNLQRIVLPEVRIQRRCPWIFPATELQRQEALDGGARGKYSALHRCGYSAGLAGGEGTLDGGVPFTSCDYTRVSCEARGMFALGRFGGVEFVPPQITVRGHGEPASHLSPVVDNEARYNDFVPLVYGTAWYEPPVVFARNDGNLTHVEVLLGLGEIDDIVKVIVNDVEIPEAVEGKDMTGTGWYNVVTVGGRSGAQNPDFADGTGTPLGDPYGSMAMASVVTPNRISSGQASPRVKVLLRGLKLERFDEEGVSLGEAYSNNPAWVLLDVLRRSGWLASEIDTGSFATAAAYCEAPISTTDLHGNPATTDRYQCNLVVRGRRSAAELARGIRLGSALMLIYGSTGLLTLRVENTLALQQPEKPTGSNSVEELNGGWPAYEFSDGSEEFSGILRRSDGSPALRLFSRSGAETANRLVVEFQDEFNEFQQDSLSLVDVDDALLTGREVTASYPALGLPNFDQATRVLDMQLSKLIRGNTFVELETTVRGLGLAPGDLIAITYLKEGLQRQLFRVVRIAPGANYQTVQITAQWHDDGWYTQGGADAIGGRRRQGAEVGLPRPLVGAVLDGDGVAQFTVSDLIQALPNAEFYVRVKAEFQVPKRPSAASVHIPRVSLTPAIATTGGTLDGGETYYYVVSAKDGDGAESDLSFTVRAKVPSGTNTNRVTLQGLSFSAGTVGFNVYRGPSPGQLLSIAEDQLLASTFEDAGITPELQGPPDENFHHANFYWRNELAPENSVESHSLTTLGNSALGLGMDEFAGAIVRITRGRGAAQERTIVSNTATTFTVTPPWRVEPDSTSYFTVAEATWKLGGSVSSSPVEFEGPPRPGQTIQISGRAANVLNRESAYELSPVTRWQIGSAGGTDVEPPPRPSYSLAANGDGNLVLSGIGFETLDNTYGITAGVMDLYWWNELSSPAEHALAASVSASETTIALTSAGSPATPLIQVGSEIMEILDVLSGGTEYEVIRGVQGSMAASHDAGAAVYHLDRHTLVLPFVKGFFGSPASGSYRQSVYLPDARVGVANLYMLNAFGNGLVGALSFGATSDQGLRTLSGGQISIQVEGYLAIEDNAAPAFVVDRAHAVRDVSAVVREAPDGGPIELRVRVNDDEYCTLTISEDETVSDMPVFSGFGKAPLTANDRISLDVVSAPGSANTLPGRDLTVTIRM